MAAREDSMGQGELVRVSLVALSKKLLGEKQCGQLSCSPEEVDYFLKETLNDTLRDQPLSPQKTREERPPPKVDFDLREPSLKEVQEVVIGARAASAPMTQWCAVYRLKEMSRPPQATVEDPESDLAKRESHQSVEMC